jgi:multidrug efflux pump subunit AcrA (membrane-fusion protein)
MYSEVNFTTPRAEPPMTIRVDALVVRGDGQFVVVIGPDNVAHFRKIELGRDYGDHLEVLTGLQKGEHVAISPGDAIRENAKVNPIPVTAGRG